MAVPPPVEWTISHSPRSRRDRTRREDRHLKFYELRDNLTLAVMTPNSHDSEFTPLPPGTIALRVLDVAEAKAKLEAAGVQVNEMWDSGVCHGAGFCDPDGNAILLHHRYKPYQQT